MAETDRVLRVVLTVLLLEEVVALSIAATVAILPVGQGMQLFIRRRQLQRILSRAQSNPLFDIGSISISYHYKLSKPNESLSSHKNQTQE